MPSIIVSPTTSRKNSRGLTEEQAAEYVELMESIDENQSVLVDESETDDYEKSYAKGERVRNAIKKFELTDRTVQVKSYQEEKDGPFKAAVSFKD